MNAGQIKAQGTYEFIKSNASDFSTFYKFGKSIADESSHNEDDDENANNDDVS